jgi:hypothetical protein
VSGAASSPTAAAMAGCGGLERGGGRMAASGRGRRDRSARRRGAAAPWPSCVVGSLFESKFLQKFE